MKARYEKLLAMIDVGLANASDARVFEEVTKEAQLIGIVTRIELGGVVAMAMVSERVGLKSPAVHPPVYRYLKKMTEQKLANLQKDHQE